MTDLIERVDAASPDERRPARGHQGGRPPLPILLSVTLGGSAVLLFAMASGHLKGTQATIGIVAALVQVALAIGVTDPPVAGRCSAPPRSSTRRSPCSGSAVEGPHTVSARHRRHRRGAVAAIAVLVGAALAIRPDTGQHVVVGDVGLRFGPAGRHRRHDHRWALRHRRRRWTHRAQRRRPPIRAGAAAKLALSTTVKVPGESSKTFQSIVAGNDTEQSRTRQVGAARRGGPGGPDRAALPGAPGRRALPDGGVGQGGRHDPGRRHGTRRGRALPGDQRRRLQGHQPRRLGESRCTRPRGSTPARRTTHRWWASCTSR